MKPWLNKIPGCYFPTSTVVVDDNVTFLNSLKAVLDPLLVHKNFRYPHEALDYLKTQYHPVLQPNRWISTLDKDRIDWDKLPLHAHSYLDIDFFLIHSLVYNPHRFEEVSTVISDYEMPEMDGIEVFKQLSSLPFQKLLLTGVATESTAVEAFNAHLIDQFILKQPKSSDLSFIFNDSIFNLQRKYFLMHTAEIMQTLASDPRSVIGEPEFIGIFNRVLAEHNIVEYYLVNESGCFLMLDFDGNPSWLVFKAEEDMDYYHVSAAENEAPKSIIKALKNREKVLFLFSKEDHERVPYTQWGKYLHDATTLKGQKNTFYYTYIPGKSVYQLKTDQITSLRTFLESF